MASLSGDATRRPAVTGSLDPDVCVVGAGFTGLWTAYYLKKNRPDLDVAVVEAEFAGYGASGRNGGWLSPLLPGNRERYAAARGADEVRRLQRAMAAGVTDVLDVLAEESIDCAALPTGNVVVARTRAAMQRLRKRRAGDVQWGYAEDDVAVLDATGVRSRIDIHGAVGGLHYRGVARIDPARLVSGLAAAVERRGVRIYEDSPVTEIRPGAVRTPGGTVTAPIVLRCTEGYSGALSGQRRRLVPVNSSMIVTPPLTDEQWRQLGWAEADLLSDAAHVFVYAQRTADGRIAIGGRGSPYRYASGTCGTGEVDQPTVEVLRNRLVSFFPALADTPVEHAWRGVLGVSRDWCASVDFDRESGLGQAGGYAGHGVTSAHVAARSLADLALGRDTDHATLAWVGHRSPSWEPEPLRWGGIHTMYRLFAFSDWWEERRASSRTSLVARFAGKLTGLD
ncbi:MAG: FAD-dependent oxidoreductase [Streptosporangiales bacterium]|nr:FAD-dependent oxidoreductase [Streptosporangiales bacterium]